MAEGGGEGISGDTHVVGTPDAKLTAIERTIKEFVQKEIQASVSLKVSKHNKTVSIRRDTNEQQVSKGKLAALWLRVLKHQNNFPEPKYIYTDNKKGDHKVILKVDNVTITTYTNHGTLMIQGDSACKWFMDMFPRIIPPGDIPIQEIGNLHIGEHVYNPGTAEWDERTLEENLADAKQGGVFKGEQFIYPLWKGLLRKWFGYDKSEVYIVTPFLDEQRMEDVCRIILNKRAEERLINFYVRKKKETKIEISKMIENVKSKIMSKNEKEKEEQKEYEEKGEGDEEKGDDEHSSSSSSSSSPSSSPSSSSSSSPIEEEHEEKEDGGKKEERQDEEYDRKTALDTILAKIVDPGNLFHAKFMCCVRGSIAEILVTSANFTSSHFKLNNNNSNNLETVHFITTTKEIFEEKYLQPLKCKGR